jgi:hypothetical protein
MKKRVLAIGMVGLASCVAAGIALAEGGEVKTPLVFRGAAAPVVRTVPKLKIVPRPPVAERIVRANRALGLHLTDVSNDYAYTLTPASLNAGPKGAISFLGASLITGYVEGPPSAMMNDGQQIEVRLVVPPTAGKVLEVDLHVQSAFSTTLTVTGMGSTQTFALANGAAQRITLLAVMPLANDMGYWLVSGKGDSWFFTAADVSTIK